MKRTAPIALIALTVLFATGCDKRKAVTHYNDGVNYVKAELYPQAIIELEKALELYPEFPEARNSLGYVYNKLGSYQKAIEQFKLAAEDEDYGDRHLAYQNLGTALSNAHRYDDAAVALNRSIDIQPTAAGYYALAQTLAIGDDIEAVASALEAAFKLEPERVNAFYVDPVFEPIMSDTAIAEMMRKRGR